MVTYTYLLLSGSPSCVSLLYPQVAVGLKSSFFGDDQVHFIDTFVQFDPVYRFQKLGESVNIEFRPQFR